MATSFPSERIPAATEPEQAARALPPALQEPTEATSFGFQLFYGLANATIGLGNITFFTLLLPAKLAQITPTNQTNPFLVISSLGQQQQFSPIHSSGASPTAQPRLWGVGSPG